MVVKESTFFLFSDCEELMVEKTVEKKWNYLLFRDSVEGPDVVLQGDSCEGVDGGGYSGE